MHPIIYASQQNFRSREHRTATALLFAVARQNNQPVTLRKRFLATT